MSRAVDYLLGYVDMVFNQRSYTLHQVFFDGLAAEALINYYEHTKDNEATRDPRVAPAIRTILDWIIAQGWNGSLNALVINPDFRGPKCSWGCQEYNTDLINLTVHAFGWYWRLSGQDIYRHYGDMLFAHSLDSDISYSGKIFSQNYRNSFDYLRYRGITQSEVPIVRGPLGEQLRSVWVAEKIRGGTNATVTVYLKAAQSAPLTLNVTSSRPDILTVPATMTIPAGRTQASVWFTTKRVTADENVSISVNLGWATMSDSTVITTK
jgi:hypothetical protein